MFSQKESGKSKDVRGEVSEEITIEELSGQIKGRLEAFGLEIDSLNVESEKEFLIIGEKLQNIYKASKEITGMSVSLADSMSGDEISSTINKLKGILNGITVQLNTAKERFEASQKELDAINKVLYVVSGMISFFKKLIKHLRILGISTKIESSRIGLNDKGFSTLAENVDVLAVKVSEKFLRIKDKLSFLTSLAQRVVKTTESLSTTQLYNSEIIINDSNRSLDSLKAQYTLGASKVKLFAGESKQISEHIGQAVISIQYHDITRQQLEHVKDAFNNQLKDTHFQKGNDRKNFNPGEFFDAIYGICKLQKAQVIHSKEEFCSATGNLIQSLVNIDSNISNVYSELLELFGKQNQQLTLESVKGNLLTISGAISKNLEVDAELSSSIEQVIKAINELTVFVDEISVIGTEVEIIALNSSIKAAHTGVEGAALGIIAESIQKLSIESREQTGLIIESLSGMAELAGKLTNRFSSVSADRSASELNGRLDEIKSLLVLIDGLDHENKSGLEELSAKIYLLKGELKSASDNIGIHLRYDRAIKELTAGLDEILQITSKYSNAADADKKLRNLNTGYTMDSERYIFNQVVIKPESNSMPSIERNNPSSEKKGDYGSNVDLF